MERDPSRPWWRPRWYELVPEAVLAVGLGWFLIDETDAATSALASSRAIALGVGVGGAWLLLRVVAARVRVPIPARIVAFGAATVAVLAVVVLPAYDDETVVETFPAEAQAPEPSAEEPADDAPDAEEPERPEQPAQEVRPEALRTASLQGIDHRAEGTAAIYRSPDGDGFVVGLEDIDIQPGPDYDVYVVPGSGIDDTDGGTRLDDLRGNLGTQYYDVPPGLDLTDGEWTVLVWCHTFAVPIANATPVADAAA